MHKTIRKCNYKGTENHNTPVASQFLALADIISHSYYGFNKEKASARKSAYRHRY